ncbi:hypothetical protein A7X86_05170 [Stenotrophomonas maltophilia]|uniref:hypothetical protein n=1 Tax=Stenotrophomonas maltophilia TaxID=40324 RepID=UPI000DA815F2|nr:hypothetical protein [Stenotrophomonas maltophilia]PZT22183.1 hypothetical protein A7X86_05170 [Stenotrophomonas maltophilia]
MGIGSAKGMLARVRKLERSHGATDEMRDWISSAFSAAIAEGRICPTDGPVVLNCVLNWLSEGATPSGMAGWGPAR